MNVIFIGKSSNLLENASMLTLTEEASDKDRSSKTQLTISSKYSEEKISGERVCRNEGFFKDTKLKLNLEEKVFLRIRFYISISLTFRLLKMATWQCIIITSLLVNLLSQQISLLKLINMFVKIMKLNCTHACMIYKRDNFLV